MNVVDLVVKKRGVCATFGERSRQSRTCSAKPLEIILAGKGSSAERERRSVQSYSLPGLLRCCSDHLALPPCLLLSLDHFLKAWQTAV